MLQSQQAWIRTYERAGALWIHDGNPLRPHALLSSGNHSTGFFNSELVMDTPFVLDLAISDLIEAAEMQGVDLMSVDCVVGPAMGAITVAHELARQIARKTADFARMRKNGKELCRRAYTEKVSADDDTMTFKRTQIRPGELCLPCEDVITTGKSVESMVKAIQAAGGIVMPYTLCLVNRSSYNAFNGQHVVSLIERSMPIWKPEDCPLCKSGSAMPMKPKEARNWAALTAPYPRPGPNVAMTD